VEPETAAVLEVIVRSAIGWPYAPAAFSQEGARVIVSDVLGRWTEPGGAEGDEAGVFPRPHGRRSGAHARPRSGGRGLAGAR